MTDEEKEKILNSIEEVLFRCDLNPKNTYRDKALRILGVVLPELKKQEQ